MILGGHGKSCKIFKETCGNHGLYIDILCHCVIWWICFRAYQMVVSAEGKLLENEQLLNEERCVLSRMYFVV